jgi:16S rRNA (cytosine967-C5)-methyltransferase
MTPLLEAERRRLGDPRDRALLTHLVWTTLRWMGWADAVLEARLRKGLASLRPPLRWLLRLGVVQMFRMEGLPAYAAVDTSVALAGEMGFGGQKGLVNAVLRGLLREPPGDEELQRADPAEELAVRFSHPAWLVRRWLERWGREGTEAILRWNAATPPLCLRLRGTEARRRAVREALAGRGLQLEPGALVPDLYRVREGFAPEGDPLVLSGEVVVQDEGEALVVTAWPDEGPVLDACAGPGTKAGLLADRLAPQGIVGMDLAPARAQGVRETARRLGRPNLWAVAGDLRRLPLRRPFPAVLVDAPCSNLGVLARRPDARWLRRPEEIPRHGAAQRELLAAAAEAVAPGGSLVYSVCSLEPEETTEVVEGFLAGAGGAFRRQPFPGALPEILRSPEGDLLVRPGTLEMEGVYAACLRRRS